MSICVSEAGVILRCEMSASEAERAATQSRVACGIYHSYEYENPRSVFVIPTHPKSSGEKLTHTAKLAETSD